MMGMHQNKEVLNLLKTTRGQLDGIIKMVEDDRYCVDVSKQLLAVQALLRKANLKIIDNHIRGCVKDAIHDGQGDDKIAEIIDIISKYAK
jgi:CsoR family transcriptional regulator, copper-sensing transcriptional repressor